MRSVGQKKYKTVLTYTQISICGSLLSTYNILQFYLVNMAPFCHRDLLFERKSDKVKNNLCSHDTMIPVLRKFPTSFSLLVKNFCFSLVFCENFQYLITFKEVSESADGLQIRDNLANPKIRNSVVIIFDSNSSNLLE